MAMLVIRKLNENKQTAATNVNVVGAKTNQNSEIASEIKRKYCWHPTIIMRHSQPDRGKPANELSGIANNTSA